MEMYARKGLRITGFGGFVKFYQGAICDLDEHTGTISYQGIPFCNKDSQIGKNFVPNNQESIERADILDQLLPLDPPDRSDYWLDYGSNSPWGWQWNEWLLQAPVYYLKNLLKKILKGD